MMYLYYESLSHTPLSGCEGCPDTYRNQTEQTNVVDMQALLVWIGRVGAVLPDVCVWVRTLGLLKSPAPGPPGDRARTILREVFYYPSKRYRQNFCMLACRSR